MRTEKQSQASRNNGAQSRGPATPQGKARSAQNAFKHGLFARAVVLANESPELYDQLLAHTVAEWQPKGHSENELVIELANARWRLRRVWAWETASLDGTMFAEREPFDQAYSETHPALRSCDAFFSMSRHNPAGLASLQRAEVLFSRAQKRAMDSLIKLQRLRGAEPPTETPFEPAESLAPPTQEAQNEASVQNEPEPQQPQSLLQFLISIICALLGLLTTQSGEPAQPKRAARPMLRRFLDPNLTPTPYITWQMPEGFHWESVYSPADSAAGVLPKEGIQ